MRLKSLIQNLPVLETRGSLEHVDIQDICDDSRTVRKGVLFVAASGVVQDGHSFIKDAVRKNAAAIVLANRDFSFLIPSSIPYILVKDAKAALAVIADVFFGYPYQHVQCIGITGTNGKTTVSFLVREILLSAEKKCGLIGTIGYAVDETMRPLKNTTPGPLEMRRFIKEMVDAGNRYVVMEVSSHALDQERICGLVFRTAIFTNLTQDHLDYHKTMDAYFSAKQKLFHDYVNAQSSLIINTDDPFGARLLRVSKGKKISYGFSKKSDVGIESFRLKHDGSVASIRTPAGPLEISTKLVGRHNLYNILAAVALGVSEGVSSEVIRKSIARVSLVPGRLDRIDSRKGFSVFVDYAHTDDALKNVLESLRVLAHNGRIITVFGCGGDRDKGKRPKMGHVATSLSDYCIITSDNPRSEDPRDIIEQITAGITLKNFEIEIDRRTAIHKALLMARKEDIVLVAGKGHESYQIIKDQVLPFDDKIIVKNIFRELELDV